MVRKQHLVLFGLALVVSALSALTLQTSTTNAVTKSDWIAGNIIDDSVFTDEDAMSVSQIQSWLDSRLKNCDPNGTQPSELGGGTRAQYGASHGNPAPFTCLNKYYEVPKSSPGGTYPKSNYGGKSRPSGSKSAAWIIHSAAKRYDISPKVLLVKLGTESAGPLTSDTWPFKSQYHYAMGARCPDSGPGGSANCDDDYAGFSIQMYEAAKLLRWYLDSMDKSWWSYKKPYKTNYILWNVVERGCGGKNVYISNKATAALYTYTPYQPNSAALNNMYGTGNNCSAYGNRNFWRVFNDWFGSTQNRTAFKDMQSPRWMQLKSSARKVNPYTSVALGSTLESGRHIYFDESITLGGKKYLRTQHDTDRGNESAIDISLLEEIDLSFNSLQPKRWVEIEKDLYKTDPLTKKKIGSKISAGTRLYASTKIEVGGTLHVRSQYDTYRSKRTVIPYSDINTVTPEYTELDNPRWLISDRNTKQYDLREPNDTSSTVPEGDIEYFDKKVYVNNSVYVTNGQPKAGSYPGSPLSHYDSIVSSDILLRPTGHRAFKLNTDSQKTNLNTGQKTGRTLAKGSYIYLKSYIDLGGNRYLRSAFDTRNNNPNVLSRDILEPVEVAFEKMSHPRSLKLGTTLQKLDPVTFQKIGSQLSKGRAVKFSEKVTINDKVYLRTSHDTSKGNYAVIALANLVEV